MSRTQLYLGIAFCGAGVVVLPDAVRMPLGFWITAGVLVAGSVALEQVRHLPRRQWSQRETGTQDRREPRALQTSPR
jgi:hypothetical protein